MTKDRTITKGQRGVIDGMLKKIPGARVKRVSRYDSQRNKGTRYVTVNIHVPHRTPELVKAWNAKLSKRKKNPAAVSEVDFIDLFRSPSLTFRSGGIDVVFAEKI